MELVKSMVGDRFYVAEVELGGDHCFVIKSTNEVSFHLDHLLVSSFIYGESGVFTVDPDGNCGVCLRPHSELEVKLSGASPVA